MKAILSFALLGLAFAKDGKDHDSGFVHGNFRVEKPQDHHRKHAHHHKSHESSSHYEHLNHGQPKPIRVTDLPSRSQNHQPKAIHADDELLFLGKSGDFPRRNQQVMEHFRKTQQIARDDFEGDELFNLLKPFHHSKNKNQKDDSAQTPQKGKIQSLVKTDAGELYLEDDFLCCRRGDGNPLHTSVSCMRHQELDDDDFALLSQLIKESKGHN